MLNQLRPRPLPGRLKAPTPAAVTPAFMPRRGRLIQVGRALCLLPALAGMCVVGGLARVILAVRGLFCGSIFREVCAPADRVGQEIFRS
jgi:hypothetical protein